MSIRARCTLFLAPLLLLAGVLRPMPPVPEVRLRGPPARPVRRSRSAPRPPAGIEVPFEVDPELTRRARAAPAPGPVGAAQDQRGAALHLRGPRPALLAHPDAQRRQTWRTQKGNCLSFVNLFVGVAREQGLNPFYVEVTDYQKWNHREGMVVSQGHIVAGMYLDGELKTYDFLPYRPKAYKAFNPIDDLTAAAHYYNNLGAEALMAGDLETRPRAAGHRHPHRAAVRQGDQQPRRLPGARRRARGGPGDATSRGLAIDPENPMILTNMTRALSADRARAKEAERAARQAGGEQHHQPVLLRLPGRDGPEPRGEREGARLHGPRPAPGQRAPRGAPRLRQGLLRAGRPGARRGTTWSGPSSWTPPTRTRSGYARLLGQ